MADTVIRDYRPADSGEVAELRAAGWKTAYRGIVPDAFLDSLPTSGRPRRRARAGRPEGIAERVAVQADVIVGWTVAGPCRDADRPGSRYGEVYACCVLPGQWRGGIGRLLLADAVATLAGAGRDDVSLWVLEGNDRARRFYEACGFQPDGTRQFLDLGAAVPEVRYRRPPPS